MVSSHTRYLRRALNGRLRLAALTWALFVVLVSVFSDLGTVGDPFRESLGVCAQPRALLTTRSMLRSCALAGIPPALFFLLKVLGQCSELVIYVAAWVSTSFARTFLAMLLWPLAARGAAARADACVYRSTRHVEHYVDAVSMLFRNYSDLDGVVSAAEAEIIRPASATQHVLCLCVLPASRPIA